MNIHITFTFVPASERLRRVQRQFCTKRPLVFPKCIAKACMPPASTIAGLLEEQTESTYERYVVFTIYNSI